MLTRAVLAGPGWKPEAGNKTSVPDACATVASLRSSVAGGAALWARAEGAMKIANKTSEQSLIAIKRFVLYLFI